MESREVTTFFLFQQYLSCLTLGISGVVSVSYQGNLLSDTKKAFDAGDLKKARQFHVGICIY